MRDLLNRTFKFGAAVVLATGLVAGSAQAELYRATSTAPGMSPFVVNAAIAKIVSAHVEDVELQVRATGAATKHFIDAAQGKVDFLFGSATINWLLANQIGPFSSFSNGPELESKIGMIFSYQIGPYHYVTEADSGIETLDDLKGKRVFVGPPGGAARGVVIQVIEDVTGMTPDEYEVVDFGFDAAIQAFQDGKIDVIILPTNLPSPAIQQFALTKEIRLLDIDVDKRTSGDISATTNVIAADAYGENQVNETEIRTHGALVNFSAGMHVDEEVVYQVTKAIWENLDELHEAAQWMPSTVKAETALELIPGRLHPGARRYYEEAGWDIPEPASLVEE